MYRHLFKQSYQRAVVPDYYGFFNSFYKKLTDSDPRIAELFKNTDMKHQAQMLMQSITYITSFSATSEATEELDRIAKLHGRDKLNLPPSYYDVWLDCLLETVLERDPGYTDHVEKAWRDTMMPGIEYMKSFCSTDF